MTNLFAWRYFRSKKTTNAINIISWISVVAVGVVTAALVVVLSVFNGFEDLVKSLYADFYADIRIAPKKGQWINGADSMLTTIAGFDGVTHVAPVVEERAILMDGDDKSIVWLKGVDENFAAGNRVATHMMHGSFEIGTAEEPALVVGAGVENDLQVAAGRAIYPVTVYLPNRLAPRNAEAMDALHSANAIPTGSFVIQQEFDNQYAFTNIDFMRRMLDLEKGQVSSLEITLKPGTNSRKLEDALVARFGNQFEIKTRYQQNQSLYVAMQVEKLIIYAVALLILLIAAFNIISTLTMMVLEKQHDIAVLHAMGMQPASVSAIFLKLGGWLAGVGGAAGFLLGTIICVGQQQFHWVKLGGQSFIIDYYPVAMRVSDYLIIAVIIAFIALVAGYFPAKRAAAMQVSLKS